MNVVVDESSKPTASVTPSGEPSPRKSKPTKRSRRNTPTSSVAADEEDMDDGASSRQRRKSTVNIAENKRRDCIKSGLESLQRALPNLGRPEEEKVSKDILKLFISFLHFFQSMGGALKVTIVLKILLLRGAAPAFQISQASVLHEAAKYIREVKAEEQKVSLENEAVRKQIDELNNQIE